MLTVRTATWHTISCQVSIGLSGFNCLILIFHSYLCIDLLSMRKRLSVCTFVWLFTFLIATTPKANSDARIGILKKWTVVITLSKYKTLVLKSQLCIFLFIFSDLSATSKTCVFNQRYFSPKEDTKAKSMRLDGLV